MGANSAASYPIPLMQQPAIRLGHQKTMTKSLVILTSPLKGEERRKLALMRLEGEGEVDAGFSLI